MTKTDIAHINGDLTKLQPSELAVLRDRIARADAKGSKNHQQGQAALRRAIAWWAGVEHSRGYAGSASYRRFYSLFSVDVASAQLLKPREALELALRCQVKLAEACGGDVELVRKAQGELEKWRAGNKICRQEVACRCHRPNATV